MINWIVSVLNILLIRTLSLEDNADLGFEFKALTLSFMAFNAFIIASLVADHGYRMNAAVFLFCLPPASAALVVDCLVRALWYRATITICINLLSAAVWQYLLAAFSRSYNLDADGPACALCRREARIRRVCPWWMERGTTDPTSDDFRPELLWCDSHQAFECGQCQVRFERLEELAIHLLEVHMECKSYCPRCLKRPRRYEY